VIKRLLRPRTVLPMGFAIGLLVLWELGVFPVPFAADAGPIERAVIAVAMAVVAAVIGFALQTLVSKLFSTPKRAEKDDGGD
jgi:hypothetical protein